MSTPDSLGWWLKKQPVLLTYGVSVLSVGATLIIARWLDLHLQAAPAVSLFICAVMFSSWFGGFRPGLLATILSVLAFKYYFVPPIYSFAVETAQIPRVTVFALAAFFVGSLSARQRSAVEALRESEQRFRDYAETASDSLWETGPDHSFTRVSEELATLVDPVIRVGATRWEIATDVEEEPEKWRLHRATLEAHQPFRHFRYRTAGADGSVLYLASSGRPLFDADGRFLGYRGVGSDVTAAVHAEQVEKELHEAQVALAHVARVATLGELTASLAHEINQPLSGVGINGNTCLRWLAADPPNLDEAREAARRVIRDGKRANEVIARIRALTKKDPPAMGRVDINDAIRDVVALTQGELRRSRVVPRMELADDVPPVLGDRVQLQQVVLNLIMNGLEAMTAASGERRELGISTQASGADQVRVAVQDAGVGLDPQNIDQLFEAFYTTKSSGMGMGLSISRTIVASHGGRLWAVPNDGPGATFQFTVPRYNETQ